MNKELAARLPGFAHLGLSMDKLVEASEEALSIDKPGSVNWARVMIKYGDQAKAQQDFMEASFWYFFARFPHIFNEESAKAYQLHTEAYIQANKNSKYLFEVVYIPFEGKMVRAFLRLPRNINNKMPVVMIWGGIDIWKSDLEIHSQGNAFLEKGIAVFAIDMPGTGECPTPVSSTAHNWFLKALEFLKQDPRFDASRIGCYGLSFGGYWATKLALIAPWLTGVVNNGGPIHHTFQPQNINNLPVGIKLALSKVCNTESIENILPNLSLQALGLLPAVQHAPLLSLNGEKDELVLIEDLYFLKQQGINQDILVFANDRHVASRHWSIHEKFVAEWVVYQFNNINN